jgi:TusA-related sulfurtransferase
MALPIVEIRRRIDAIDDGAALRIDAQEPAAGV